MVGQTRLELVTPRLSSVCSNQLSYRPFHLRKLVEVTGFEPMTFCLQSRRSTNWAIPPLVIPTFIIGWVIDRKTESYAVFISQILVIFLCRSFLNCCLTHCTELRHRPFAGTGETVCKFSIERRWSSRRFPYGYLVTTSSQLPTTP